MFNRLAFSAIAIAVAISGSAVLAPVTAQAGSNYNFKQPTPVNKKQMREERRKLMADSGRIGPIHPICFTPLIGSSTCLGLLKPTYLNVSITGQ